MEKQEKNVKRNKQEESAAVRSDRSRIYLQRSNFEKRVLYTSVCKYH